MLRKGYVPDYKLLNLKLMGKVKIIAVSGNVYAGNSRVLKRDTEFLNGVECDDDFVEYFDENETIKSKLVSGKMYFEFNEENRKLYTVTEYNTNDTLTPEELEVLGEYTQGQWSDGIGEGFEQYPCTNKDGKEIFVCPWYENQKLTFIQE